VKRSGLKRRVAALTLLLATSGAHGGEVIVAVAANFTAAMREIATAFEKATGHTTKLSFGSTGKLYAQIRHGAPFAIFLAADQQRPQQLVEAGRASDQLTYAIGKLVLWSAEQGRHIDATTLQQGDFSRLAIANPKTAPYGAAAVALLQRLGLYAQLQAKLVTGDSIAQTYQFVSTGNAPLGLVAQAQLALDDRGSRWPVPDALYPPIRQDAVLLTPGRDNPAAQALLDYLQSAPAQALINQYGYGSPPNNE